MSYIMGPTPILEMARAYGLRPRLRLLTLEDSEIYECGVSELTNKLFTYDRVLGIKRMTTAQFLRAKFYCLG